MAHRKLFVNLPVDALDRSVDFFTNLTQDHGFMYARSVHDPDGHHWEVF